MKDWMNKHKPHKPLIIGAVIVIVGLMIAMGGGLVHLSGHRDTTTQQ